jgi:L-2-hydroxycarboxylate dehydrogenase (NAD+)
LRGAFRPLTDFTRDMDELLEQLSSAPRAAGQERIYIHGEKEFEKMEEYRSTGIPLPAAVVEVLKAKGKEAGVEFDVAPLR